MFTIVQIWSKSSNIHKHIDIYAMYNKSKFLIKLNSQNENIRLVLKNCIMELQTVMHAHLKREITLFSLHTNIFIWKYIFNPSDDIQQIVISQKGTKPISETITILN